MGCDSLINKFLAALMMGCLLPGPMLLQGQMRLGTAAGPVPAEGRCCSWQGGCNSNGSAVGKLELWGRWEGMVTEWSPGLSPGLPSCNMEEQRLQMLGPIQLTLPQTWHSFILLPAQYPDVPQAAFMCLSSVSQQKALTSF